VYIKQLLLDIPKISIGPPINSKLVHQSSYDISQDTEKEDIKDTDIYMEPAPI